jgi:hypothetical protein
MPTRRLVRDGDRLAAAVAAAGFADVTVERIEEVTTFAGAADLVRKSLGWWACAWRLEAVPAAEREAVQEEATRVLLERLGDGEISMTGTNVVVSAVRPPG